VTRPALIIVFVVSAAMLLSSAAVIHQFNLVAPVARADNLLPKIPAFEFEGEAQHYCPNDSVIWATPSLGIYNISSERWYGRTSSGVYGCLREAEHAGYRANMPGDGGRR
jgi:hypothetical protein